MRSNTQSVSVDVQPDALFNLVADVQALPRWAIGFAKNVIKEDGGWVVETGQGLMPIEIVSDSVVGSVDFRIRPAPGVVMIAHSRVLPRGEGSEYVFTQFQPPGMPDEVFDGQVAALTHELSALKAIAEVQCPL
jgi:hypothetical protein